MTEHINRYTAQVQNQDGQDNTDFYQRAKARLRAMKQATEDVLQALDLPSGSKFAILSMMFKDSHPREKTFVTVTRESDERLLVEQMLRGQGDEHWEGCYSFVKKCVYARAHNLPGHLLDDMVQEVMLKITKYLPHFRFQCALRTWVNQIIEHQIIDEYRKRQNDGPHLPLVVQPPGEADSETPEASIQEILSTGDAFETREQIRVGIEALLEYANATANPVRNRHILRLVLFEGKTYEEAAKATGCHAPVVGYVVREAQLYARRKWNS